jgi:hypothetical protein
MIALVESGSSAKPDWHARFLELLPDIRNQLRYAFRNLEPERRAEAIQEALALALVAYVRLFEQGKAAIAYATPLAKYAARQYRAGRRVGTPLNCDDVLSKHGQRFHGIVVERLDRRNPNGEWKEILVEDRGFTPAETAAARIDVEDWLSRLCRRDRGVATTLAAGEGTRDTARKFALTAGRISQLRTELRRNWQAFQGESVAEAGELAMAGC